MTRFVFLPMSPSCMSNWDKYIVAEPQLYSSLINAQCAYQYFRIILITLTLENNVES